MRRVITRSLAVALVSVVLALLAAFAWGAAAGVEVSERFTPDRLGASANLALTSHFASPPGGAPAPVRKFTVYAPAGMLIDARGAGVCSQAVLEAHGPEACPADSRAGFGGGIGVLQLPGETVHEGYTLDFFFSSTNPGHLSLLVYASARSPVNVELIVIAHEVRAPAPYGLGFSVEVPPISTIPGAPLASIESAFASLGAANVAYYKRVHGRLRLVHVRGLVVPRRCPAGGFPSRATIDFRDGQSLTLYPKVPCPAR
ncbi:MAG TPA: hypothetical protein VFW38_09970 [Solirubrobacteraceae bacterium]|nr:hypothetical protein [Solirubrobacteraceae bacterium]